MDLLHFYLLLHTEPDKHDEINKALTGPLDTYRPTTEPAPQGRPKLRPPAWSKLTTADLDRMARHRAAQAAQGEATPT